MAGVGQARCTAGTSPCDAIRLSIAGSGSLFTSTVAIELPTAAPGYWLQYARPGHPLSTRSHQPEQSGLARHGTEVRDPVKPSSRAVRQVGAPHRELPALAGAGEAGPILLFQAVNALVELARCLRPKHARVVGIQMNPGDRVDGVACPGGTVVGTAQVLLALSMK